jgi:hypothetical protein
MRELLITVADAGNGCDILWSGTSEYSKGQIANILLGAAEELLLELEDEIANILLGAAEKLLLELEGEIGQDFKETGNGGENDGEEGA